MCQQGCPRPYWKPSVKGMFPLKSLIFLAGAYTNCKMQLAIPTQKNAKGSLCGCVAQTSFGAGTQKEWTVVFLLHSRSPLRRGREKRFGTRGLAMKKSWIKWLVIGLLAVIVFVVGVPIIINECYKTNSGYMTMWGAADVLSYYGTILGVLVAASTIAVTISFTQKQIQRESVLKTETEKWAKIEEIFATALDTINPIRPLVEAMDTGMTNPTAAIMTYQKYQMRCKTAMDRLIAFLGGADYPKVKKLIYSVNRSTEEFSQICDKEIAIYNSLQNFSARKTAEDTLKMDAEHPNYFPNDTLLSCQKIIDETDGVTIDTLSKSIAAANQELVSAYETTYRNLLQLKCQIFETISIEIQEKADHILRFGKTK